MKNVLRTAAALAVLLLAPAALAQSRTTTARSSSSSGLTNVNVLLGFEDGDGDTGLALRGDVELLPTRIAPNANVSLVLSLGYTRFSDSYYGWEWSMNLFKLVPAARFSFDVAPRFGLYGDAGLGLYFGNATVKQRDAWGTWADSSNSDMGVMMRLAAGAKFAVTPTFALGAELGVNPYFGGDYDNTTFSGMLLASFRM